MKTRTLLFSFMSMLLFSGLASSQTVEEEIGFKYVKGNYLFDSGRYDEAIQVYNDIIKGDPTYENALVYRGKAKYALGAYKGTKRDGLAFIDLNGLNSDVCEMMGKAELGLGNPLVAISYLDYSVAMNNKNAEALLFRGNAYFEIEDDVAACTDWSKAAKFGSDKAAQQSGTYCMRVTIPVEKREVVEEEEVEIDIDDSTLDEDEVLSTDNIRTETVETEVEVTKEEEVLVGEEVLVDDEVLSTDTNRDNENPSSESETSNTSEDDYIFDSSDEDLDEDLDQEFPMEDPVFDDEPLDIVVEIIEVDEDLDLKIYDGIGSREVREVPDILILSDKAGQVVVDICVDQSGNVISASLNRRKSTVGSAGLISLALRKSREFKFERTRDREQCGKIAFMLK